MTPRTLVMLIALTSTLGLVAPARSPGAPSGAATVEYVCAPCGCGRDGEVFPQAGACPACGMALVRKGTPAATAAAAPADSGARVARKRAAILVFNGVQIIDYTGPFEVFGQAGLEVFTVAPTAAPITTAMGMRVTPSHTLADAPPAEVLVIPGGDVGATQQDSVVLAWIRERAGHAEYVMSVCNGAYILAATRLLDGLTATTFHALIAGLEAQNPRVSVVRDQRFVDNGRFITTAGLSSGIDGALHVVSRMYGEGRAQLVALGMEYDWRPESGYARASFADAPLRSALGLDLRLPVAAGQRATVLSTRGDAREWQARWQVDGPATPAQVLTAIADALRAAGWTETKAAATSRRWRIEQDGIRYDGEAQVRATASAVAEVTIGIRRVGESTRPPAAAADQIVVREAAVQEMPPNSPMTSARLIIDNRSGQATALVAARANIARTVELHRMDTENGVMSMRRVDRIELPVGSTEITGDFHLMLIGLNGSPREGDQVQLALEFSNGVRKSLSVPVRKRAATEGEGTR